MSVNTVLDQIKDYPLSDLIGHFIGVKREGANYAALCPFHGDSTPSLKINDSKKIFKCFACGAAGDHIKFVMDYKNLDFKEALKEIAQIYNIPVDDLDKNQKVDPKLAMAQRVLSSAQRIFTKAAETTGKKIFQDFLTKRGLTQEIADQFGIGFAPAGNVFSNYLQTIPEKDQKFAIQMALDIGIVKPGKTGLRDFFQDRITFPIRDHHGQVVAFNCRAIRDDQVPKYLHSKESLVFHKRNILFGLDVAKSNIRQKDSVIICEGNMDAIVLHQFGFTQAVATQGVALTEFAINRVKAMTQNFYLAMDNDNAGMRAINKINEELIAHGIYPKYIDLSPAKDPDDFLHQHGSVVFYERIEQSKPVVDVQINNVMPKIIPDNSDQKLEILVGQVFPLLAPLGNSLMASERLQEAAKKLGIRSDSNMLMTTYQQFLQEKSAKDRPKKPTGNNQNNPLNNLKKSEGQQSSLPATQQKPAAPAFSTEEKLLVRELLTYPQALPHATEGKLLDFVTSNEVKRLVQWVSKIYLEVDENEFLSIVKNSLHTQDFPPEISELINSVLFNVEPTQVDAQVLTKIFSDIENLLEMGQIKNKRQELLDLQKTLSQQQANEIIAQINDLDRQMLQIKTRKTGLKI